MFCVEKIDNFNSVKKLLDPSVLCTQQKWSKQSDAYTKEFQTYIFKLMMLKKKVNTNARLYQHCDLCLPKSSANNRTL